ncbi:hypothetical protein HYW76_05070 [Candidatus Pacearchaeota archaeon]|nr:hypothetical protein [Candidatus Pacearchaeota archaeon]
MLSDLQLLDYSEENLEWFQENSKQIQEKFERKIIAIKGKKIIASADNMNLLLSTLKKEGIDSSEILIERVPAKNEIIIL